ncbi:probable rRNA-processing protein EBP2 homolog [Beta vulgaris subsp. vulgaris]|uniref:probable rRNA-processing protein EBP2 homolog n=1 Tax=Beta vulgaris subsp. vulgaris TaxID=3555 RepID=UPI002036AB4E|nr:probable rRNA-processing protein EBP2 homolog [Beta vulgaris subsp. vulgaris]
MVVLRKYPSSINGDELEDDEEVNTMGNNSESEEESESDDEEQDDIKLTEPSKTAIYNKDGLADKLSEISWPDNVDWMHTLDVVIDQEKEVDVNDDLAREAAFYTQAIQGTRQAFAKLESKGVPFLRPFDYYAEMVKTDVHMGKVKGKLLMEKKLREEQDERRKSREAKKMGKQVQAEKEKERAKEKKEHIESVKKWRKQRQRSGFANDKDEMKLSFEEGGSHEGKRKGPPGVRPGDRSGGKAKQFGGRGKKGMDKNRKSREFRDSKFGFGGRKGGHKQNSADTTNDIRGFNNKSRSGNKKRKMS